MEYKAFAEELKKYITGNSDWNISEENYRLYEDGYTSTDNEELSFIRHTNIKYNHIESDVLVGDFIDLKIAINNGGYTSCRFSVKYLYDEYTAGGWDAVERIVSENIKMASITDIREITNNIANYSFIHSHLIVRPINFPDNRYELKNCIYKQVGDIALVLYALIYDDEKMGVVTAKIPKAAFDAWNKDISEVWQEAVSNTNVWAPPRMYMKPSEVKNASYEKGAFMALNAVQEKMNSLYVPTVTTTKQQNGAIAMFYPGVQEKIAQVCGGSYYVVFTSIHDARIHVNGAMSVRQILQSLKDVNKKFNKPEEILSRKVFYYDSGKKELEMLEL